MSVADRWRPAWADIDLGAVRHNASVLARLSAPASLCAVVKADGYGHGALAVATAALEGGATCLAVALVEEGVALREGGIDAPVLLLSEPPVDAVGEALSRRLTPTVYTKAGIEAVARAVDERCPGAGAGGSEVDVHVKADTGMHRVGADPDDVPRLAALLAGKQGLRLAALWTHLAVAEGGTEEDRAFTALQLERFDRVVAALAADGLCPPVAHVANSAGAIGVPAARRDLVRCGIALYGVAPSPSLAEQVTAAVQPLRPVLSLRTRVTYVRDVEAGERPSYGRRRALSERSLVATAPIGYADGLPRRLFDTGGEVLVGGVRRPLAGTVTMDQIVIDCGPADSADVRPGDEVVLLGRQGAEEVTAVEWAERTGTISYEILCGIGARVPRLLHEGSSG